MSIRKITSCYREQLTSRSRRMTITSDPKNKGRRHGFIGSAESFCPGRNLSGKNKQTDSVRVSFPCGQCQECLRRSECNPDMKERTAVMIFSLKTRHKLIAGHLIKNDETRKLIERIRNGVETIPSVIRNKYGVDRMPVRGKLRTKQFFGFKVTALNFTKRIRFMEEKTKCRAFG